MDAKLPWDNTNLVQRAQLKSIYADKYIDHLCSLETSYITQYPALTGIVCTIGPSNSSTEIISKMIEAGMNACRVNFSHGTHESNSKLIESLRTAASIYSTKLGRIYPLALAADTKGPEIRTGFLKSDLGSTINIQKGSTLRVTNNEIYKDVCDSDIMYIDFKDILKVIKPGDKIYLDNGLITLTVKEVGSVFINCNVENDGKLGSQKKVNLPSIPIDLPIITQKDINDLTFAVEHDFDIIMASFIRSGKDVKNIRNVLGEKGKHIIVLSKIQNLQGVENIDEIIKESDGIMIAGAIIGIEITLEKVFLIQKNIIAKCNKAGKPVLCGTRILNSFVTKSRPTKADITDVANIVLDGVDSIVMFGNELVDDFNIVECVRMVSKTCREAENMRWQKQIFSEISNICLPPLDPTHSIAISAVEAALKTAAKCIVVSTTTGRTAKIISHYKPICPIITITRYGHVARKLMIWKAVHPLQYITQPLTDWHRDLETRIQFGISYGKTKEFIHAGDAIVIVIGWKQGAGFTNTLKIVYASAVDTIPILNL